MKKVNLLVSMFGSLALIAGATSCSALQGITGTNDGNFTTQEKQNVEALTGIKLLESTFGGNINVHRAAQIETTPEVDTTDIEKVLPSIDVLLNNGSIIESTITEEETIVNEVTYSFKEVITYKDAELKDATYTLVYNKESIANDKNDHEDHDDDKDEIKKAKNNSENGQTEVAPEQGQGEVAPETKPEQGQEETKPETKPETGNKPNKEEIETKEKLVGLILISDTENYSFNAMNKTEIEEGEQESKRSFKIQMNETSYIEVVEKSEIEATETETKFEYTFVQNEKVELNYSLKIENEKDELTEVTYEVNEIEYEVTKSEKEGKEIYKVEREDSKDNEETFFFEKILNEDGTTSFVRI